MNNKAWLYSFIAFTLVLFICLELAFQLINFSRTEVDYVVKEKLSKEVKENTYETLVLGDSLGRNALSTIKIHNSILDLTTNNAISLAGQYFIIKRYLQNNPRPKNIFLFTISEHLYENLDTEHTYLYFKTVFTNEDEISEIKALRPGFYDDGFSIDSYTESRLKLLKFLTHFHPKPRIVPSNISLDWMESNSDNDFMNEIIRRKINIKEQQILTINEIPEIYLEKINSLCKDNNIEFTLVLEPMPKTVNEIFNNSKVFNYIETLDIRYININDYYTFSNNFFKTDGIHISGNANIYYQNLIDKHVLDLY